MGVTLYEYDCVDCGATVVVSSHPKRSEHDVLWCPDCSAVEVDYTVDLADYDDATVVKI